MANKKQTERKHFKKRVNERFGIYVNNEEINRIIADIKIGDAPLVEKQTNRVSVYLTEVQGVKMNVVYDHRRKMLVTCLFIESEITGNENN